jgi:hypothetical protein
MPCMMWFSLKLYMLMLIFFVIIVNEVATNNNQQWIGVQILILFTLEKH